MKSVQLLILSLLLTSCSSILSKSSTDDRILSKMMTDGSTPATAETQDEETKQITGPITLRDNELVKNGFTIFQRKTKKDFNVFK